MSGHSPLLAVRVGSPVPGLLSAERSRLIRQAKLVAWGGNAWHLSEFAIPIAIGAGIAASSVGLIGFGADGLIEGLAGFIIIWCFSAGRADSQAAERRAQRLVAASYFLLRARTGTTASCDGCKPSPYGVGQIAATTSSSDTRHHRLARFSLVLQCGSYSCTGPYRLYDRHGCPLAPLPRAAWDHLGRVGIGLTAMTAPMMPLLALAKRRVGHRLGSAATANDGTQNMICAYLSVALLVGLLLNATLPWWWADPMAALIIAAVALREGVKGWRGEDCGCCAPMPLAAPHSGTEGCCR